MENFPIEFYYDFSNPKNSSSSLRLLSCLTESGAEFRSKPITEDHAMIEPEIMINLSGKKNSYHGSLLDLPKILGNLRKDLKYISKSKLNQRLSGSEYFEF